MPRDLVVLACEVCQSRNYVTKKNKRLHPDRVEHKKFCKKCNTHTLHRETR